MICKKTLLYALPLAALTLWASSATATSRSTANALFQEDDETPVEVSALPGPVQATARQVFGKLEGLKAVREREHGEELFEVEGKSADGSMVSILCVSGGQMMELERQIPVSALPAQATPSLLARFPGATIVGAEEIQRHYFEVKIQVGGKTRHAVLSASGRVQGQEQEDEER